MPDIEINDLTSIGAVADVPGYMLPPEAWSLALNMRVVDLGMEKMLGWREIFEGAPVVPHFAIPILTETKTYWVYNSPLKTYVWDGETHTNITMQEVGNDVNWTTTLTRQWNGTLFAGTVILNNGIDTPRYWPLVDGDEKMFQIPAWNSEDKPKIIRAFGPFLMAFNLVLDDGLPAERDAPHMVKWSHPADPGTLPISWDETDPTVDAGEVELPDSYAGVIEDALPLSDTMYIYKGTSTWKCRFIGGRFIFDFGKAAWLTTSGILAPRCVATTGDGQRHVVATQDDIIWHNGNTVQSILDTRQRRRLFNEIDTDMYINSFMLDNPLTKEMYFCYPSSGADHPNRALVMNYSRGDKWAITEMDGVTFRNGTVGPVEGATDEDWEASEDSWEVDDGPWSSLERRRLVVVSPDNSAFYVLDAGLTRDGQTFAGTLRREGLALTGRKRTGEWIVDFQSIKMFDALRPKIQGGPVDIRMGYQMVVDGSVTWGPVINFDPTGTAYMYAGPVTGRAGAIELTSESLWRLDGYKIEVKPLSEF